MLDPAKYSPRALWKKTGSVNMAVARIQGATEQHVAYQDVATGNELDMPRRIFEEQHEHLPIDPDNLIVSGIGHRPEQIVAGNATLTDTRRKIFDACTKLLAGLRPQFVITNMSPGFGQWFGWAAITAGVPLVAAIPHPQQTHKWTPEAQAEHQALLDRATHRYPAGAMAAATDIEEAHMMCSRWMVDNSQLLITAWRGKRGRTAQCLDYARQVQRPRLFINNPDLLP